MRKITTSAPGKLMLFGEHSVVYGFPCIVTAVNQRVYVSVEKREDLIFSVIAPEVGVKDYSKHVLDVGKADIPRQVVFLEILFKRFLEKYPELKKGVTVLTQSEFSCKFGFGSSSAITVAFAKALSELFHISMSKKELFDLCYQAILDVQGVGSGFDLAAAIWGGTIYYVKPAKIVEQLSKKELPLIVGYTGIKADTVCLVKKVEELKKKDEKKINQIFSNITDIVMLAKRAILDHDWEKVGLLMTKNQDLLMKLGVSSTELDLLINAANNSGSFGSKLSGAGGGDCMISISSSNKKPEIELNISRVKGQILHVQTHAPGVRVER